MFIPLITPRRHLHQVEFRGSKRLGKKRQETVYQLGPSKQYLTLMTTQLSANEDHQLFTVSPRDSHETQIIHSEEKMKVNLNNDE